MAGVKRAATITRTGKNAVTVWAKRQCSHQSLQLPVDSLTVTVLPPATCLVHTGGDKETRRQSCLLKKNKIVPGIICQFRLALNMRPLTVSLTQAGLCWSELHCHHQQCRRQGFFSQETRLLHITTSKSACCIACDCYLWFTHQTSESYGGVSLHKHCKLSSKLRIMTWFHETLLTAEDMTSYMGLPRAAFSPDWPHYDNKEQSLCSWSKYLLTPLPPTEVAWQVRHDFTCITVCFN